MSIDELIRNPNHVQRLWNQARPAADKSFAASEHQRRLADIKARVGDGSYRDDGAELDASLNPLLDALMPALTTAQAAETMRVADTRDDRTGEDDQDFQADFAVQNH